MFFSGNPIICNTVIPLYNILRSLLTCHNYPTGYFEKTVSVIQKWEIDFVFETWIRTAYYVICIINYGWSTDWQKWLFRIAQETNPKKLSWMKNLCPLCVSWHRVIAKQERAFQNFNVFYKTINSRIFCLKM